MRGEERRQMRTQRKGRKERRGQIDKKGEGHSDEE